MIVVKKAIALAVLATSLIACEKFDEGGFVSRADNRIDNNSWSLDKYLRNGNDETSTLKVSKLVETYNEDGTYVRTYIDADSESETDNGTWELTDKQKTVKVDGNSSISDFSTNVSSVSSSTYTIVKLKGDDYWYKYDNGGDTHEFHFIKK